jgi:hypothetical protein
MKHIKKTLLLIICTLSLNPTMVRASPVFSSVKFAFFGVGAAVPSGAATGAFTAYRKRVVNDYSKWKVTDRLVPAPYIVMQDLIKDTIGKEKDAPIEMEKLIKEDGMIDDTLDIEHDEELAVLLLPDEEKVSKPLLAISIKEEYKYKDAPLEERMCPNGVGNIAKSLVPNMKSYAKLQQDMCLQVHGLTAYKVTMTNDFRKKINKIQTAIGIAIAIPEVTSGINAGKQTTMQALYALEQLTKAEYRGKMALANAKIAIAEDMRGYAAKAITSGPIVTKDTAREMALAKVTMGTAINVGVLYTSPYNK